LRWARASGLHKVGLGVWPHNAAAIALTAPVVSPSRVGSAVISVVPTGNSGTRSPWVWCSTRTALALPTPTLKTSEGANCAG
jgi:hypothetical protein